MSENVNEDAPKAAEAKKPSEAGCLWFFLGMPALVILLVVGCVVTVNVSGDGGRSDGTAKVLARNVCRDAVKNGLKAPSSANFAGEQMTVMADAGSGYDITVKGMVEAQNSFGGMVGYNYECKAYVPKEDGTSTGRVISMRQR